MARRCLILGAVLLGFAAVSPGEASAFFGRHGGYCCSPCCCGGWYGGYGGGYGGYGGWYGGYGGGYGGYGGWYGYSSPVAYYAQSSRYAAPVAAIASAAMSTSEPAASSAASLVVRVPAAARVYVNGYLTKSTGEIRRYTSPGLIAGASYKYELRVEVPAGEKSVNETRTVSLAAGDERYLTFDIAVPDTVANAVALQEKK